MRLAAGIAVGAAVVDLLVLGLLHVVSPEVDPVARAVSEYALGDFGLGRPLCGRLLRPLGRSRSLWRCGANGWKLASLLVFGLLKLAMLVFPVDALGAPVTSAGQMHNLLGNLTFFLFPVAALVLFRPLRRRGSRSAPVVAVALAIATAGVLVANAVGVFGLAERAYLTRARSGCFSPLWQYSAISVRRSRCRSVRVGLAARTARPEGVASALGVMATQCLTIRVRI